MENRKLGDAIRSARLTKGYTQEKLAEMLEIAPIHLKNIEGGRRNPSVPLLFQMMEMLDMSVDSLVFSAEEYGKVLHLDGLNNAQIVAISQLVDTIRFKKE